MRREKGVFMQDNAKVMAVLGLIGLILTLMGVGVWALLRSTNPTPVASGEINPVENPLEGQIDRAEHAVGPKGIIEPGIERFHLRMGRYPQDLSELVQPPQDAEGAERWRGPYVNNPNLLDDPWGNPYRLRAPGTHHTERYDLWSAGPDGADGTSDDIGNW
jgi:type II secretion system protein G